MSSSLHRHGGSSFVLQSLERLYNIRHDSHSEDYINTYIVRDLKELAGILAQGRASMYMEGGHLAPTMRLEPSLEEFNLREDPEAALAAMEVLQEAVPFHFVGKHSAYAVRITRDDFTQWDARLEPAHDTPEGDAVVTPRAVKDLQV